MMFCTNFANKVDKQMHECNWFAYRVWTPQSHCDPLHIRDFRLQWEAMAETVLLIRASEIEMCTQTFLKFSAYLGGFNTFGPSPFLQRHAHFDLPFSASGIGWYWAQKLKVQLSLLDCFDFCWRDGDDSMFNKNVRMQVWTFAIRSGLLAPWCFASSPQLQLTWSCSEILYCFSTDQC